MTNNKSIHDIIHDKYSCILKGYEDKIAKREKFKINLKDSKITCYLYNNGMELEEYFPDSKKTILIVYQTNGKVKMLKSFVDGSADGNCFVFNENGEISSAFIFVEGRISNVVTDKVSLKKLKLDEWFLNTCESEKDVKIETDKLEAAFSFNGLLYLVKIDDLYEFLSKKCSEELEKTNIDGLNQGTISIQTNGHIATYSVLDNKICSRSEHIFFLKNSNEIRFDDAGYITKFSCGNGQDTHRDCFWFEHGKLVKMQSLFEGKIIGTKLFNQPEKNVKAEYDVLKNKLVEAYQAGSELESKTKEASKRIELEIKKLHEAKDENSELKKSIAKEIEELRSKCSHKFEYYGSDSHRDYECCIFCELTR